MARMITSKAEQIEAIEDDLARLGSALVYLRLVTERVDAAARFHSQDSILRPAIDDLVQAARLVRSVQRSIAERPATLPLPARCICSECSRLKNHEVHANMVAAHPGRAGSQKRRP